MQTTNFTHTKTARPPAEYTIYAYNKYCENTIGLNKWQCLSRSQNASDIVREATRLFETEKFQKIEIKKKVFDTKKKCHFVSTFQVLDNTPKNNIIIGAAIMLLALSCGGLFLLELL